MSSLVKYYALLIVLFIVVVIYNIAFYSTFKADQCKTFAPGNSTANPTAVATAVASTLTNSTSTDNTTANNTASASASAPTGVQVNSTLTLVTLPLILVIVYGAMAGLTLLALLGITQFGDMPSERFGSLPWYWACIGFYVRNFAFLIKVASYVALLLILVQAAVVFLTSDCTKAVHTVISGQSVQSIVGAMYDQAIVVILVDISFWGFTHILLPLFKKTLDQEAFLYEPVDSTANQAYYVLCNLLGP